VAQETATPFLDPYRRWLELRRSCFSAQSLGVMLNLQNEMLRTQATGLKLQAQSLAIQNKKDKDRTRQMVDSADKLNAALAGQAPKFELPRFE
jgi:hypothetical protein